MSYWSDLEREANPLFIDAFGQDPVKYTDVAGHTYDLVVVLGNPPHADGGQMAYCDVWAPAASFVNPPVGGDQITTPIGKTLTVFAVHEEKADGQFEPSAYWLSLNETS